jgi:solute carrier family 25 (mitochondrial thiamine pyrophosphate transporter), member 19
MKCVLLLRIVNAHTLQTFKPILHSKLVSSGSTVFGAPDALAGITAGIIAKSATYPLDTIRKRLQVQGPSRTLYVHGNIPEYLGGVIPTLRAIVAKEGLRGLYRGLSVALVKAAPSSAMTVWTFERVMKGLKYLEQKRDTQ